MILKYRIVIFLHNVGNKLKKIYELVQKVAFFGIYLNRRGRKKLIYAMRGYRFLKDSNQIGKIYSVLGSFMNNKLICCEQRTSKLFFGTALNNSELIIRQYLQSRVANLSFNKSLLCFLGKHGSKVVHPLPSQWRKLVEQNGFKVDNIKSALLWYSFVTQMWAYGTVSIIIQSFKNLKMLIGRNYPLPVNYVFFDSLNRNNLPQPCEDGQSFEIITWYLKWPGRISGVDNICHNVRESNTQIINDITIISIPSVIPPLGNLYSTIRYISWGIGASIISLFNIFIGHWWHPLMLHEASIAKLVSLQTPGKLAREYFFHNSNHIYRPLWTYEAEKKGSKISFYFYSTNNEGFKSSDGYRKLFIGWRTATWPRYLVWNTFQGDFIRRTVDMNAIVDVVGPIWFSTIKISLPDIPQNSIAVFDVQPVRDSYYQILGIPYEYYTPETAVPFIKDIYATLHKHDVTLVLKRKRNIGHLSHYKFRQCVDALDGQNSFIAIDPDLSAFRVIEKCVAVISMPFTSTAIIGRELGKPSIYYDPSGFVKKNDRAAHGIPILTGPQELSEWLNRIINKES